jgi:hypothetical protein
MMQLRFRLLNLQCIRQRSQGEYGDTLIVGLMLGRRRQGDADITPVAQLASQLGMRGPRADIVFQPGGTHDFKRTDFSAGTDLDWVLDWDVEDDDDTEWVVNLQIWNDREVKDPYTLTRALTVVGLVASGVGAGAAIKASGAAGVTGFLLSLGSKGAFKGFEKAFDAMIGDWPKCAGPVFAYQWRYRANEWLMRQGRDKMRSAYAMAGGEGCGNPEYILEYEVERRDKPLLFGPKPAPALQAVWLPYHASGSRDWAGAWRSMTSRRPQDLVTATVVPSEDKSDTWDVMISEVIGVENGTVVDATVHGVAEKLLFDLTTYDHDAWAERALVSEGTMIRTDLEAARSGLKLQNMLEALQTIELGASGPEMAAELKRTLFQNDKVPLYRKQAKDFVFVTRGDSWEARSVEVKLPLVDKNEIEARFPAERFHVAALELPEQEAVLMLYARAVEVAKGTWRSDQPFIRYIRAAHNGFTPADIMLAPVSGLR